MAEIRVDPAEVAGLALALTRAREALAQAPPTAPAAGVFGDRRLEAALHDVTSNWARERARLDDLLARAAAAAHRASVTYAAADAAVAAASRASG